MKCPTCNAWVEVKETRPTPTGAVRRRYVCANLHRFTTHETVVADRYAKKATHASPAA